MNDEALKVEIERLKKAEAEIRAIRQKKESELRTIIYKGLIESMRLSSSHLP